MSPLIKLENKCRTPASGHLVNRPEWTLVLDSCLTATGLDSFWLCKNWFIFILSSLSFHCWFACQ